MKNYNVTNRLAKKIAKRFLAEEKGSYLPYGTRTFAYDPYADVITYVTEAVFPAKVTREIERMSINYWDGCHWSHPCVLKVVEKEEV